MGAAGSVPMTQEAALAAGHTQEQVDAYQTIQGLVIGRNADGEVTRQQFCQTLMKHDENDATRTKLGLSAPTEGETVTPVATFRAAFEEAAKGMDGGADAKTTASEVAAFLATFKAPTDAAKAEPAAETASTVEAAEAKAPTKDAAAAVPALALPKQKPVVMEFSSTEFSKTSRPKTATKVPSRFSNRPVTSRRASKSATSGCRPGRPKTSKRTKSKEEIQATKAIASLIIEADEKQVGCVTRAELMNTLEKHAEDKELQKKLGLMSPKAGEPPAILSFRKSIDEGVKTLEQGVDGHTSVPEIASFLKKYQTGIMAVVNAVC